MGEHESCPIPSISVRELLEDAAETAQLVLVAGADGLDNALNRAGVQKPGLALTGFLLSVQFRKRRCFAPISAATPKCG